MLRASAKATERSIELRSIVDVSVPSQIAHGAELLAFTDAAVLRDEHEIGDARAALAGVAGDDAVLRAAAVAGNFEMMNRLLDATGVQLSSPAMGLADRLGVTVPEHLRPGS